MNNSAHYFFSLLAPCPCPSVQAFNPKCGSCSEIIKGPYVSALDQSWHPEHFVCTHCKEPFGGNQFRKHDNKPVSPRPALG